MPIMQYRSGSNPLHDALMNLVTQGGNYLGWSQSPVGRTARAESGDPSTWFNEDQGGLLPTAPRRARRAAEEGNYFQYQDDQGNWRLTDQAGLVADDPMRNLQRLPTGAPPNFLQSLLSGGPGRSQPQQAPVVQQNSPGDMLQNLIAAQPTGRSQPQQPGGLPAVPIPGVEQNPLQAFLQQMLMQSTGQVPAQNPFTAYRPPPQGGWPYTQANATAQQNMPPYLTPNITQREQGGPVDKPTSQELQDFLAVLNADREGIPIIAHPGEYVLNANAVKAVGEDRIDALNQSTAPSPSAPQNAQGGAPSLPHMEQGGMPGFGDLMRGMIGIPPKAHTDAADLEQAEQERSFFEAIGRAITGGGQGTNYTHPSDIAAAAQQPSTQNLNGEAEALANAHTANQGTRPAMAPTQEPVNVDNNWLMNIANGQDSASPNQVQHSDEEIARAVEVINQASRTTQDQTPSHRDPSNWEGQQPGHTNGGPPGYMDPLMANVRDFFDPNAHRVGSTSYPRTPEREPTYRPPPFGYYRPEGEQRGGEHHRLGVMPPDEAKPDPAPDPVEVIDKGSQGDGAYNEKGKKGPEPAPPSPPPKREGTEGGGIPEVQNQLLGQRVDVDWQAVERMTPGQAREYFDRIARAEASSAAYRRYGGEQSQRDNMSGLLDQYRGIAQEQGQQLSNIFNTNTMDERYQQVRNDTTSGMMQNELQSMLMNPTVQQAVLGNMDAAQQLFQSGELHPYQLEYLKAQINNTNAQAAAYGQQGEGSNPMATFMNQMFGNPEAIANVQSNMQTRVRDDALASMQALADDPRSPAYHAAAIRHAYASGAIPFEQVDPEQIKDILGLKGARRGLEVNPAEIAQQVRSELHTPQLDQAMQMYGAMLGIPPQGQSGQYGWNPGIQLQ